MWDFSWLERRWPGAGQEDWRQSLHELRERGYDAVRIDAYPHLVAAGATTTWRLSPRWTTQDWGSPASIDVVVGPALVEFMSLARDLGISVALSSWFRRDATDQRLRLDTPESLAASWLSTLELLDAEGLLDTVLWVDLCNEFPMPMWAPYVYGREDAAGMSPADPRVSAWTSTAIGLLRERFGQLAYTFSFSDRIEALQRAEVGCFDILEPHVWMASSSDFYQRVGYRGEQTDPIGYERLAENAWRVFDQDRQRYTGGLMDEIDRAAQWSRAVGKPLATTECWAVVDYKDWPRLDWGWVKELNALAVERACSSRRWLAIATSNFCAPQFVGMWRDVDYHQRLTTAIRSAGSDFHQPPVGGPAGVWGKPAPQLALA